MAEEFPYSGLPIHDDDETIRRALEDVSIPTLMMSMIHMTGDASILEGDIRPAGVFLNEVQGFMTEEEKAVVREKAFEVIKAYRDGGSKLPSAPSPETIHAMMRFLVAEDVPAEYVPMMLEEMELDGADARAFHWDGDVPEPTAENFRVLVIGCGVAGLLAGIRLGQAGIPYTVVEKNASVGGTWYENTYPGCRVDVGNHFYCYSFEPNPDWTEFFAQQGELREYFENCADKYRVREHTRFSTEVVKAVYDETDGLWDVTLRQSDQSEDVVRVNAVISAVGQLNRAKLPQIEGIESFRGVSMHSSQWQHDVDLKGKRVAVIGTGASAFQIVPSIADETERLTVFQRSAPWMFANPNYHEKVGAGKKWALKHLPYYGRWYRFLLFWPGCDGGMEAMKVDPNWEHQDRAVSELNDVTREMFTSYLTDQVPDDEELQKKIIPNYVCLGKRVLQDNGSWLTALQRDDVELVTDAVECVTEDSIVCENGDTYPVDIIVYATGFHANKFLWPMEIRGRGGVVLSEQWGDEPTAYLGITMPNFPNLFCVYGPGTNLAHGGSLIFHSECQVQYILECFKMLIAGAHRSMECKKQAHDDYVDRLDESINGLVWSHPSITNSWYKNDAGRVTVLSPWRLVDYWKWTKRPDVADYEVR